MKRPNMRKMTTSRTIDALGALAQDTRLALFRVLVERGPAGLSAGIIAEKLRVPSSSLSFHLQQLVYAGLISQRRLGRQIIYAADFAAMNGLMVYLTENCCGGAKNCAPVCDPATSFVPSEKVERGTARVRRR